MKKLLFSIITLFIVFSFLGIGLVNAHEGEDNFSHHGMMYGLYGYMAFGWLWMIVFWGAIIWFIVWLINNLRKEKQYKKTPLQILKERYAKGKLTKKEYENMKKELK